jgi:hypothetical protein
MNDRWCVSSGARSLGRAAVELDLTNVGLDAAVPALKLPAIGRLGLDR